MATPSRFNSFGGSSLGSFKTQQGPGAYPSAYDRLQKGTNPGSDAYNAQLAQSPGSMGLSDRPAKAFGRSMYDPARLAQQAFRSTTDPMQRLQLGIINSNLTQQTKPDEFDQALDDQTQAEGGGAASSAQENNSPTGLQSMFGHLGRLFGGMGNRIVNNAMNGGQQKLNPIFIR